MQRQIIGTSYAAPAAFEASMMRPRLGLLAVGQHNRSSIVSRRIARHGRKWPRADTMCSKNHGSHQRRLRHRVSGNFDGRHNNGVETMADKARNLHGQDLHRRNFAEANLRDADLTNVDLTRADLTRADLTHADLTRAPRLPPGRSSGPHRSQIPAR